MNSILAPNPVERAPRQSSSLTTRPDDFAESNIVVNWERGEIRHRSGSRYKLSARESALLACLASKAGTPVSRDEILSQVWQLDPRRTITRTIDMHVSLLRRKLDDGSASPRVLIAIHGVGYMLQRGAISFVDDHPSADETRSGLWEIATDIESFV